MPNYPQTLFIIGSAGFIGSNLVKGTLGDIINTLMAAAAYNMRHWMNKHALSSFISRLKTLVGHLENVIIGNENNSVCLCPSLAMVV